MRSLYCLLVMNAVMIRYHSLHAEMTIRRLSASWRGSYALARMIVGMVVADAALLGYREGCQLSCRRSGRALSFTTFLTRRCAARFLKCRRAL